MSGRLTRKQLAQELGVSERTIDRWRVAGRMPFHRETSNGAVTFSRNVLNTLRRRPPAPRVPAAPAAG